MLTRLTGNAKIIEVTTIMVSYRILSWGVCVCVCVWGGEQDGSRMIVVCELCVHAYILGGLGACSPPPGKF